MAYRAPILTQIVKEVNRYDFKNQVSKYDGDRKVSKLTCFGLLVEAMICNVRILVSWISHHPESRYA
jgi:hypothetical protein